MTACDGVGGAPHGIQVPKDGISGLGYEQTCSGPKLRFGLPSASDIRCVITRTVL